MVTGKHNLVEYASRHIDFTFHDGDTPYYSGFCPFHHNVNTPAFVVYPNESDDKSVWLCFSCHPDPGDIIDFVRMEYPGMTFAEAVRRVTTEPDVFELAKKTMEMSLVQSVDEGALRELTLRLRTMYETEPLSVARRVDCAVSVLIRDKKTFVADAVLRSYGY